MLATHYFPCEIYRTGVGLGVLAAEEDIAIVVGKLGGSDQRRRFGVAGSQQE